MKSELSLVSLFLLAGAFAAAQGPATTQWGQTPALTGQSWDQILASGYWNFSQPTQGFFYAVIGPGQTQYDAPEVAQMIFSAPVRILDQVSVVGASSYYQFDYLRPADSSFRVTLTYRADTRTTHWVNSSAPVVSSVQTAYGVVDTIKFPQVYPLFPGGSDAAVAGMIATPSDGPRYRIMQPPDPPSGLRAYTASLTCWIDKLVSQYPIPVLSPAAHIAARPSAPAHARGQLCRLAKAAGAEAGMPADFACN